MWRMNDLYVQMGAAVSPPSAEATEELPVPRGPLSPLPGWRECFPGTPVLGPQNACSPCSNTGGVQFYGTSVQVIRE